MKTFKITWPQSQLFIEAPDIIAAMGEFADNYIMEEMEIHSVLIQEVP